MDSKIKKRIPYQSVINIWRHPDFFQPILEIILYYLINEIYDMITKHMYLNFLSKYLHTP